MNIHSTTHYYHFVSSIQEAMDPLYFVPRGDVHNALVLSAQQALAQLLSSDPSQSASVVPQLVEIEHPWRKYGSSLAPERLHEWFLNENAPLGQWLIGAKTYYLILSSSQVTSVYTIKGAILARGEAVSISLLEVGSRGMKDLVLLRRLHRIEDLLYQVPKDQREESDTHVRALLRPQLESKLQFEGIRFGEDGRLRPEDYPWVVACRNQSKYHYIAGMNEEPFVGPLI